MIMRNLIFFKKFFVFFIFVFACFQSRAQFSGDSVQVIIGNTLTSNKQIHNMKDNIIAMPHIKFVSYCPNHNIYILYADKNFYNTKTDFFNALVSATNSSKLLLKEGEIKDIITFCEYDTISEYDAAKKELDK